MSKNFTLKGLERILEGWSNTDVYNIDDIMAIEETDTARISNQITSIPSPFARFDLARQALNFVTKGSIDGRTIYHKIVSEILDVGELFFNFNIIQADFEIVTWNKQIELNKFGDAVGSDEEPNLIHNQIKETLEMYFRQDNNSFNFDTLDSINIIRSRNNHKVLGCTSPITLFVSSSNDLSSEQINIGSYELFSNDRFVPLYERTDNFIIYLYNFFYSNVNIKNQFKDFSLYLDANLTQLRTRKPSVYQTVRGFVNNTSENIRNNNTRLNATYNDIEYNGNVKVLNYHLKSIKIENLKNSVRDSDFIINSPKYIEHINSNVGNDKIHDLPLILSDNNNEDYKYIFNKWNIEDKSLVPYKINQDIDQRYLPGVNFKYPFLVISDLVEPYIIKLPYNLNKNYFNGNLKKSEDNKAQLFSYLLPLKKEFFKYFDVEDLINKKFITITELVNKNVRVDLVIPVKDNKTVKFQRTFYHYNNDNSKIPNEGENKGIVLDNKINITISPFFKLKDSPDVIPDYRVQLTDKDYSGVFLNKEADLSFFDNNIDESLNSNKIVDQQKILRRKKANPYGSKYYKLNKNFNFIQYSNLVANGIIVPNWKDKIVGDKQYTFAIDFGTTNTHIEYSVNDPQIAKFNKFEINQTEVQYEPLFEKNQIFRDDLILEKLVLFEFLPDLIGAGADCSFPTRTLLSVKDNMIVSDPLNALCDSNIPLYYFKSFNNVANLFTNLKWAGTDDSNKVKVKAYFENLFLMIRNKVLMNKGDVKKTKIVWFYPSVMGEKMRLLLSETVNESYSNIFNSDPEVDISVNVKSYLESAAPFYYYTLDEEKPIGSNFSVSFDIGGGTTDIMIFEGKKAKSLTSIKFAANNLFSDTVKEERTKLNNGFVLKYKDDYKKTLETKLKTLQAQASPGKEDLKLNQEINAIRDLVAIYNSLIDGKSSVELNSFLFSLEENMYAKDINDISYSSKLGNDPNITIVFLYFYASLLYYVTSMMKSLNYKSPANIFFSGKGSNILNLISKNTENLSLFAKAIINKFYSEPSDQEINITKSRFPKEVTCKGGLIVPDTLKSNDMLNLSTIYTCLSNHPTNNKLTANDYTAQKQNLESFIKKFNTQFIEILNSKIPDSNKSYADIFELSSESLKVFTKNCNKGIIESIENAIEKIMEESKTEEMVIIKETLFFYPITTILKSLSKELSS